MQIGKANWKYGKEGIRNLSSVANVIRNINFNPTHFNTLLNAGGISVSLRSTGGDTTDYLETFKTSISGGTVSITAGTICFGDINYPVPASSVTLGGANEYVYVYHKKDHSASGFGHSGTRPSSAGEDSWKFTLATYTATGTTWTLANTNHVGDIIIAMAI